MEIMRERLQGVSNIIRFNWPFYVLSLIIVTSFFYISFKVVTAPFQLPIFYVGLLTVFPIVVSLLVSFYIYDLSGLYKMDWLPKNDPGKILVNINAGFDETSEFLKQRYAGSSLLVYDFYDPKQHTEASIERARNAYPAFEGTQHIFTNAIPLENGSADTIYLIFAAHEIRNDAERIVFLKELNRVLKAGGQIIIAEHLRDASNFIAYTIGFFHFLPMSTWTKTFSNSGFKIAEHKKHTPFINIFTLQKHGDTL
jgi:SAM-dependent methyltransferase